MKKMFSLLLIVFLFFGCGPKFQQKKFRDKYMFSVKTKQSNFTENIPFSYQNQLITIPVIIKGKKYHFLFDTGAVSTVSPELKDILVNIKEEKTSSYPSITDAAGITKQSDFALIPKLSIGNISFYNLGVNVFDLSNLNKICISIDGVIGANFMRNFFWKINFQNQIITFSDREKNTKIKDPKVILPFEEDFSGSPISKLKWSKYNFIATWDTGYNGSLQIPDSLFFNSPKYKKMPLITGKGIASVSIYKPFENKKTKYKTQYQAIIDSLYFISGKKKHKKLFTSNLLLKNQEIKIEPYPSPPLLGIKFMKKTEQILFDWKNHEITMKKNPGSPLQKSFGFTPFKTGNALTVVSLWDNSEANKQGLQLGDTLVSINGKDAMNISRQAMCNKVEEFENLNKIEFMVKRGKTTKSYSIKKHDLFE